MYMLRLRPLKEQLSAGRLPEREGLRYVLATFGLFAVLAEVSSRIPMTASSAENVASVASFVIFVFGSLLTYSANGGDRGTDFLGRYIALGWVLGIRVFGAMFAAIVVASVGIEISQAGSAENEASIGLATAIVSVLASGIFYWRLAVHIRDVAFAHNAAALTGGNAAS